MTTPLTKYAGKYGINHDFTTLLAQKSGLTPVFRGFNTQLPGALRDAEQFQKSILFDYTTQQLQDLDAISERRLRKPDIRGSAVPFWSRGNWYNGGGEVKTYRRAGTRSGRWVGSDEDVWAAVQECIIMASKLLNENVYVVEFINHLIIGDQKPIARKRVPRWTTNRPDRQRPFELTSLGMGGFISPERQDQLRGERVALYKHLQQLLTIAFKTSNEDPFKDSEEAVPEMPYQDSTDAWTEGDVSDIEGDESNVDKVSNGIYTFIDFDIVAPLLGDRLNDAERLGLQYWIATTLVHESIHALWIVLHARKTRRETGIALHARIEPYVVTDQIMELGFAMEGRALGGHLKPMWKKPHINFGYWVEPGFPTTNDIARKNSGSAVLQSAALDTAVCAYPVPVSFFEAIHNEDFWQLLPNLGTPLLQIGALKEGVMHVVVLDRDAQNGIRTVRESAAAMNRRTQFDAQINVMMDNLMGMTPDEKRNFQTGYNIHKSLRAIEQYYASSLQLAPLTDQFVENGRRIAVLGDNAAALSEEIAANAQDAAGIEQKYVAVKDSYLQTLRDQFAIVKDVFAAHQARIAALEVLESVQGQDQERRAMLSGWNYDTRVFVRSLVAPLAPDNRVVNELHDMDFQLEITRLRVWDVNTADGGCRDSEEYRKLMQLWRACQSNRGQGSAIVLQNCQHLFHRSKRGQSLLVQGAIKVITAHAVAYSDEMGFFAQAKLELQAVGAQWARLYASGIPRHGRAFLDGWTEVGRMAMDRINAGLARTSFGLNNPVRTL
ncbi:hypothetical protein LZ554_004095 [Drepanopeziza brunnea f. sp. 'monogermtubi']|nr:hypothetical protein LZ554_004095 [Drepanopeziza brunnea f. sp. 'monogermtubi']